MSNIETILLKIISKFEEASEAAISKERRRLEVKLRFRERKIKRLETEIGELKERIKNKDSEKHPKSPIRGL